MIRRQIAADRAARPGNPLAIAGHWQERAACYGMATDGSITSAADDPFFNPALADEALRICAGCPVRAECGQLVPDPAEGVWGGVAYIRTPGRPRTEKEQLLDARLALHARGLADQEIAEIQGVDRSTVVGWRLKRGLMPNPAPRSAARSAS